jgi:small subunit ribosomal protein S20
MATTKSAEKRARQTAKRTAQNRTVRNKLRRAQKQFSGGVKRTAENVRSLISEIDRAAKRGIIHKNAANRRKSRLKRSVAAAS